MKHAMAIPAGILAAGFLSSAVPASAVQGFGNEWVGYNKDNTRLVAASRVGLGDTEEKDYAFADFDKDGWTDLVCVRKELFTTQGRRTNVLFMNRSGILTDETALYAIASDVSGDQGFLTPTNDRDVVAVDIDQDGWMDVVTSTTLSPGQPKHISHPRVYLNLGEDGNGDWLGLRFEEVRFPQLLLSDGTPSWPRFCEVAAGDVTGDGFPDLYFVDYEAGAGGGGDMNDRLLINDGTGHFVDESALRMTSQMLASSFGLACAIGDLNLDGANDIVKNTGGTPRYVSVSYNDPANEGFFDVFDNFHHFAPYYTAIGDLNNDGRLDVVIGDDGPDRYRYNLSTNASGEVVWSAPQTFEFLVGQDDGFTGNIHIADLDGDGWQDVVIADVDVYIGGCGRRMHIYHNPGGTLGQEVILREEAEAPVGGWRGVVGMLPNDVRGVHDVAIFDIDGDGDLDMVVGQCTGTNVWMNEPGPVGTRYCFCDAATAPCDNPGGPGEGCANGGGRGGLLAASESESVTADDLRFLAEHLLPGEPVLLFVAHDALNEGAGFSFGDGLRCAGMNALRLGVSVAGAQGTEVWGPGLAELGGWEAGDTRRFQVLYRDPDGTPCGSGFNLTNGVEIDFTI